MEHEPEAWSGNLKVDPVGALLASKNEALRFITNRDLLDFAGQRPELSGEATRLLARQTPTGAWIYPGGGRSHIRSAEDYNQIETYRVLGLLVEKHALDRSSEAIERAAHYLFGRQTEAGDFRGVYGSQYTPNYSAGIIELLIKAGYGNDPRTEKGFVWLLAHRQADGGWAIPLRTVGAKLDAIAMKGPPIEPDQSKPSSHLITGIVLRAFAAHPAYRNSNPAQAAADVLAAGLFQRDNYPDRGSPAFWTKFSFPFWFTDVLSALDALSLIGMSIQDPRIGKAVDWFIERQGHDGVWHLDLLRMKRESDADLWITLAVCRVLRRLFEPRAAQRQGPPI
jgi:hypothetical protein